MTLNATAFVINIGTEQGLALLCPECRYASVLWRGADRIDRKFAGAADWQAIEREIREGLPPTVLPSSLACVRVLAGSTGGRVQWMWGQPVEVDGPEGAAVALDAILRSLTA